MGRPQPAGFAFPDEQTLQAWEDMRVDLWHELQEGADAPDDLVDLMGQLVVMLKHAASARQHPAVQHQAA